MIFFSDKIIAILCENKPISITVSFKGHNIAGEYEFEISSAATSTEEIWNGIGNPVYPPAKKLLAKKGIDCSGKRARQMTRSDYDYYDLLIGMDNWNIRNMLRITGGDPDGKIKMLLDFTNRPGEVADPWYSGDFETTYRDVLEGCEGILNSLPIEGKVARHKA